MADWFSQVFVAAYIISLWSTLYRENKIYGYVQSASLGCYFGYSFYIAVKTLFNNTINPMIATQDISLMLVTFFGLILLLRLVPRYEWISRNSLALLVGITIATGLRRVLYAQVIKQLQVGSIFNPNDLVTSLNNIIILIFTASTIVYFVFSREHTGIQYYISRIGRLSIMVAFGAMMATFFMGNVGYSIVQVQNLVTGYGSYVTIAAAILIIIDIFYQRQKK